MITYTVSPIRVQASGKSKPALILVSKGKPNGTIVISSIKSRTSEFAARELNDHLEKITGTRLPVVTDVETITGQRVLVGKSAATDALRLNAADFKNQEYLVSSSPGTLILMGKDDPDSRLPSRTNDDFWSFDSKSPDSKDMALLPDLYSNIGTLYAVYDFLENDCGVRWYAPGELGVVADKQATLNIETEERRRSPVMTYREVYPTKLSVSSIIKPAVAAYPSYTQYEKTLWLLRLRAGGENVMPGNHSFYGFYDRFSKQYGKNTGRFESDHPEFFAKGLTEEQMNKPAVPGGLPNLCYSSQALVDQFVKDARDYFDGRGLKFGAQARGDYFAIGPMDMAPYCKCPDCTAAIALPKDEIDRGFSSNYWFGFVNRVAKELRKTHPDKYLSTLSYASYAEPPSFALEPNISVSFCLLGPSMYWDPARRERDIRYFERGWSTKFQSAPFYCWVYYLAGMMGQTWSDYPEACAFQVPAFIRKLHESGVKGLFITDAECMGYSFLLSQLELYLTLKLADDPTLNSDDLIDEFFLRYYGTAAMLMKQLYQELENVKFDLNNYPKEVRRSDKYNYITTEIAYRYLLTPGRTKRWNNLMDSAIATTQGAYHERLLQYKTGVWDRMMAARSKYLEKNLP
jgi:hypothetical protein